MDSNYNIISNDIWYGANLEDIEYWVKMAIKEIMERIGKNGIHYEIEEVI